MDVGITMARTKARAIGSRFSSVSKLMPQTPFKGSIPPFKGVGFLSLEEGFEGPEWNGL
jgi:hypothetical protein